MINYGKLWGLLESKGLKKTDLLEVVSSPTLAKLSKNENVNVEIIGKICDFLECQPGDIMENISEKKILAFAEQMDILQNTIIENLKQQGIEKEEFATMMSEIMPNYFKQMFTEGNATQQMMQKMIDERKVNECDED